MFLNRNTYFVKHKKSFTAYHYRYIIEFILNIFNIQVNAFFHMRIVRLMLTPQKQSSINIYRAVN